MRILRSRSAAAIAFAGALSLSATPALARDWHRHRDDGIGAGDIFAGLLIVGGIAAIASAASSKAKRDRQARADDYREDDRQDYRGDYRGGSGDGRDRAGDYGADDDRVAPPADYGASRDQAPPQSDTAPEAAPSAPPPETDWRSDLGVDRAVDACAGAVERGNRSIEAIDGVNREGEGWRVEGRARGGYGFACAIDRQGRVKSVEGL